MRLLLTGIVSVFALFAIAFVLLSRTEMDGVLTEAQNAVGFPPGANGLEPGQISDHVEGPQLISLPVRFQLPGDSDLEDLLSFYRARCDALGATSYGLALNPEGFGGTEAICDFLIDDRRFSLNFALSCDEGCVGEQTVVLQD